MERAVGHAARYGDLLRETLPRPIRTEAENEQYLRVVEHLMSLGKRITPEQRELLDLLVLLIERFEAERYTLNHASPVEALRELMQQRSMKLAGSRALHPEPRVPGGGAARTDAATQYEAG